MVTRVTVSPTPGPPPPYTQYLRKVGLIVYGANTQGPIQPVQTAGPTQPDASLSTIASQTGLDLSDFRIVFRVEQFDVSIPNTANIRVYNLSRDTANRIQKEFQYVTLQAGYRGGNYGVIFSGTIKQFKRGRVDALTSYLDIFASDGDQAYNFAYVNASMAAGSTVDQRMAKVQEALQPFLQDKTTASIPLSAGTGGLTLPRGKVMFGLGVNYMNNLAATALCTWNIVNGKVVITNVKKYAPGTAIQLNAKTGLVFVPEATDNGIEVVCLLNPAIKIGQRIQINNRDINTTTFTQAGQGIRPFFPNFPATVTNDGFYRCLVVNHGGDSRGGNEWYTYITALALDSQDGQVATGG